jgi:hypothetical protein
VSVLDRLLGRKPDTTEDQKDKQALDSLRDSFKRVQVRTDKLEDELARINEQLRRRRGRP